MSGQGKRYKSLVKQIDEQKYYPLNDAVALIKTLATAKFDETVELHFRLGIDPRHSDQMVRSTVLLPHGLGKTVRVLVFAEADDARVAQAAGADIIADDELIKKIAEGSFLAFDAALAVPSMMAKVGRLGKVLGPRGLMPSPKAGTVVPPEDVARAVQELKAGRVEFRSDKTGNIHVPIGKASFEHVRLLENAQSVFDALNRAKPAAVKGIYMRRAYIASTMSPGLHIDLSTITQPVA